MAKINNIKELRDDLLERLNDFNEGKVKAKDMKEITNISGKIIMSAKVQDDYNKRMKNDRKINFLESED